MNVSERRQLANLKERLQRNDCAGALRILQPLLPRKASPKAKDFKRARSARKAAKSEKHRLSTGEIRAACIARESGRCAAEGLYDHGPHAAGTNMDHWLGGSGQRRQRQSVETCWMLCRLCDWRRTNNVPSARRWNTIRRTFCIEHGYEFQPHMEHAKVPAPQAPESIPERIAK